MGGYGSTRWGQAATKQRMDSCLCLELARLRPYLGPGAPYATTWRWSLTGGGQSGVGVRIDHESVCLSYTAQRGGSPPVSIRETLAVEWTLCAHGGARPWFRCPGCGRRCAALYLPPGGERFRCRRCHHLAYGSQQVTPDERHLMAIRKIQSRLVGGMDDISPWWLPPKPKGMHWRTYDRLSRALLEHEEERAAILGVRMARFVAHSGRVLGK